MNSFFLLAQTVQNLCFLIVYIYIYTHHALMSTHTQSYGVATINRINKTIGLFCRIASLLWGSFAKETYNFIDPTNISYPIWTRDCCLKQSRISVSPLHMCLCTSTLFVYYGEATISRLLRIVGLFCRI